MNILLLSRYDTLGASSRIRSFQYTGYLQEQGIRITISSLLDNQYLLDTYQGRPRNYMRIIWLYLKRVMLLVKTNQFQLLWIEKELFPWLPPWAEVFLQHIGCKYVVDYDDPLFHNYDQNANYFIRKFMGEKIDSVMKHAAVVIAGNDYIRARAQQVGATRIELLPTAIDLTRYQVAPTRQATPITIGWIGSPKTMQYLRVVQEAITEVSKARRIRMILVGSGPVDMGNIPIDIREWTEQSEVQQIQDFDIGIMPLVDQPQERGKCGYKLIQYMACGRPVVASPVGVNKKLVEHGINGFHASSTQEWITTLSRLCDSSNLRKKMGQAGRRKVESQYCTQVMGPRLASLLFQVAGEVIPELGIEKR